MPVSARSTTLLTRSHRVRLVLSIVMVGTMRSTAGAGLWLMACATACGDDAAPPGSNVTGIILTTGADEGDDDPDGGSGVKLDLSSDSTMGSADDGGSDEGCTKVDVIFAVDNSGSMTEEHQALAGPVFDSFPQTLLSINGGIDDFHLAVIDACPKPANFHDTGASGACGFSTGTNYMISSSPNLAAEFACVSAFSPNGYMGQPDACIDDGAFNDDDEQPGLTAAEAVSGAALMAANSGFLRDDALLFIVTITDEDEELADIPSTQAIFDQIVAAKGGDINQVVYLGIAGGSNCTGPYGTANDAVQSRGLANLFVAAGRGVFWDLCMGDLETAFQTAIEGSVDEACQDFVPEG